MPTKLLHYPDLVLPFQIMATSWRVKVSHFKLCCVLLASFLAFACKQNDPPAPETIKRAIRNVMEEQVRAWNEGNIEKFMVGYLRSDSVRFVSGGNVSFGWQSMLERYEKSYPDKATMGKLTFGDIDIDVISENAVLVFGRWQLRRETDEPWGYFSLLFRSTDHGWRIVHDHTSAAKTDE